MCIILHAVEVFSTIDLSTETKGSDTEIWILIEQTNVRWGVQAQHNRGQSKVLVAGSLGHVAAVTYCWNKAHV